jgi:adenylate cyclase
MAVALLKHRRTLAVICLAWTLAMGIEQFRHGRFAAAERSARDWLTSNGKARPSPQHPRLVYLGIDEEAKTLDSVFSDDIEKSRALQLMKQGYPWNREVYALIIDRLAQAGARAIAFDILFPAPRFGDQAFHDALHRWHDRVVIGTNFKDRDEDVDAAQTTISHKPVHVLPTPMLRPPPGESWLGFVNVRPDDDQVVRRMQYRATALEFFGIPPEPGAEEVLSLSARTLEKAGFAALIPKTHAPVAMRFCPPIQPHSVHEIFVESQWAAPPYDGGKFFRDKIVLIGAAGNEAEDRATTPFGTVLGPTIHLSAINAALNNDFIRDTTERENLALIIVCGLAAWLLGARVSSRPLRLLLLGGLLAGFYFGAQWLYNSTGLLPVLLGPFVTLAGSGITWTVFEQAQDLRERQRVRQTLEKYVSRDAVREILDNPSSFLNSLGGERRAITVLFSDIRSFTNMAESSDPHALVKQLNEYFNEMVGLVFANEGTLDKFIGDAVMAHWGSIVSAGAGTDTRRAMNTVIEMRVALARLNASWKARGLPELQVGFGLNHGDAIVGNLGCDAKMEVSVLGDAVNLGSRLEAVTKEYGIDVCIGEDAAALVRGHFILRSVDLIVVKGKTKPVEIFTILGERKSGAAEPAWLARHEEAVRRYRAGDFAAAEIAWREVLVAQPGDSIAKAFLARCAALGEQPPGAEWTGVFTMRSK